MKNFKLTLLAGALVFALAGCQESAHETADDVADAQKEATEEVAEARADANEEMREANEELAEADGAGDVADEIEDAGEDSAEANYNVAIAPTRGRLLPFGWLRFLLARSRVGVCSLGLDGCTRNIGAAVAYRSEGTRDARTTTGAPMAHASTGGRRPRGDRFGAHRCRLWQ